MFRPTIVARRPQVREAATNRLEIVRRSFLHATACASPRRSGRDYLMIDELIAEFDRRLNGCWFDGVLAVVAAGALTASLRFVVDMLSAI
jgi:hypothetical protein